jgi:uncharacterized protein
MHTHATHPRTKMAIRPIGRILHADRNGYLPQVDCSMALQPDWQPLANAALEVCRSCLGDRFHSVYVRGSVARGTAVPGVSDIDIVALAAGEMPDGAHARLDDCADQLLRQYSIASGVELVALPEQEFLAAARYRSLRFAISLGGYPLGGADVRARLARPRLGPDAITHAHQVSHWRRAAIRRLAADDTDENVRLTCRRVMKRILRSAFELVMLEINGYTRDLYPCTRLAAREFPSKAPALWTALDLAVNPTTDRTFIADVLAGLSDWLEEGAKERFGLHRVRVSGRGRPDRGYLLGIAGTAAGRIPDA